MISPVSKFCPSCKQANPPEAARCFYCNVPLETSQPGFISTTTRIDRSPSRLPFESRHLLRPTANLPVNVLALFELNSPEPFAKTDLARIVLGRGVGETNDGALIDLTPLEAAKLGVSRQHALIVRNDDGFTVQDLNSTNGTWVNEFRLAPGQVYPLNSDSLLRLGQLTLQVFHRPREVSDVILFQAIANPSSEPARIILTPHLLQTAILPFLISLAELQHLLEDSRATQHGEVRINAISLLKPDAPIIASVVGLHDAIQCVRDWINPWRLTHTDRLVEWARLSSDSQAVVNDDLQNELLVLTTDIVKATFVTDSESQQHYYASALATPLKNLALHQLQLVEENGAGTSVTSGPANPIGR